ncbi:(Fe-S)-binding protein [Aquitalea magnusonii]|nr:(Fe-S)-binding protein [Aquitalea magnusonii]
MSFSLAHALTGLFWLGALLLLGGLARRASLWQQGRSASVSWLGLLAMPKRYFVDIHHVVAREPAVARAHVAAAGGGVAILLLSALNYGLMLYQGWLDVLLVLMAAVMLLGVRMMQARRLQAPPRLSQGRWQVLPARLRLFALGSLLAAGLLFAGPQLGMAGQLIAVVALLMLALGGAELALGIGLGWPMKHAVAGLLHLAFHPRAERFAGKSSDLKPLNLAAGELGVAKVEDFAWNRLLSFDACVQCGKCEAACPAYAAGQPLNPKKLIQDMVAAQSRGTDPAYAGNPHPGREAAVVVKPGEDIVGSVLAAETLWSCTTCRACVENCPMLIEHVDTVVNLRRHVTLSRGDVPGKGSEALANLRNTDTVGGYPLAVRYHWAIDLDLPVLQPGEQTEWLLLAGEGAFDMRYQRALRALVKVLKAAGVKVAVLGEAERDCGDVARRLGDEAGFQRLAKANIATLVQYRFAHIVTPDPHVFHCLANEYPALGGQFDVWHHSKLLEHLLARRAIPLKADATPLPPLTFHDPCYLGRYNDGFNAPRNVLKGIGIKVVDMQRSGRDARCCGWGGGAAFTDIPGQRRIPDMRMDDIRETGTGRVAVACPNCTAMLEGVVGERADVIELAELVAERLA